MFFLKKKTKTKTDQQLTLLAYHISVSGFVALALSAYPGPASFKGGGSLHPVVHRQTFPTMLSFVH